MAAKLFATLRVYARLLRIHARMDFSWLLRDTRVFLVCVLAEIALTGSAVAGMLLLAHRFGGLGGLTQDEVLFMLGFGLCVEGLSSLFFGGENTARPSRRYGRGQLDNMMIQPVPILLQFLTDGFLPVSDIYNLIGGIALICVATGRLGLAVTPGWLALLAGQMLSSLGVLMGFLYLTAVPAFYAPVAGEEISSTAYDFVTSLRQFPLGAMPLWLRAVFSTVLPVGLLGWLPASLLTGSAPVMQTLVTPLLAALFLMSAAFFTWKGWKHYATYGSPRYTSGGLRN